VFDGEQQAWFSNYAQTRRMYSTPALPCVIQELYTARVDAFTGLVLHILMLMQHGLTLNTPD
jgi:hypothetical protein